MAFSVNAPVPIKFHQIRKGEDLAGIARKYNTTTESIQKQNPETTGSEGEMLVINQ